MKRTRTKLEENLIEKGYNLAHKTYTGKNSDRVYHYVYQKTCGDECIVVLLNSKRNYVNKVAIHHPLGFLIEEVEIDVLKARFEMIKEEVYGCLPKGEKDENGK